MQWSPFLGLAQARQAGQLINEFNLTLRYTSLPAPQFGRPGRSPRNTERCPDECASSHQTFSGGVNTYPTSIDNLIITGRSLSISTKVQSPCRTPFCTTDDTVNQPRVSPQLKTGPLVIDSKPATLWLVNGSKSIGKLCLNSGGWFCV
jgi:hypothetical protein